MAGCPDSGYRATGQAQLRAGRIDDGDVSAYLAKMEDQVAHPDASAGILPSAAFDFLTGAPLRDLDQRIAELKAVTTADVHEVATEAFGTALLMVPPGCTADWAGFTAAPQCSVDAVQGARIQSRESDRLGLLVGKDGVTRTLDGSPATVKYDRLVAMMAWADGARRLIGDDGVAVHIEPTLWKLAQRRSTRSTARCQPLR